MLVPNRINTPKGIKVLRLKGLDRPLGALEMLPSFNTLDLIILFNWIPSQHSRNSANHTRRFSSTDPKRADCANSSPIAPTSALFGLITWDSNAL
jgi:hypothetical protein